MQMLNVVHAIDVRFESCPVTRASKNVNSKSSMGVGATKEGQGRREEEKTNSILVTYTYWLSA